MAYLTVGSGLLFGFIFAFGNSQYNTNVAPALLKLPTQDTPVGNITSSYLAETLKGLSKTFYNLRARVVHNCNTNAFMVDEIPELTYANYDFTVAANLIMLANACHEPIENIERLLPAVTLIEVSSFVRYFESDQKEFEDFVNHNAEFRKLLRVPDAELNPLLKMEKWQHIFPKGENYSPVTKSEITALQYNLSKVREYFDELSKTCGNSVLNSSIRRQLSYLTSLLQYIENCPKTGITEHEETREEAIQIFRDIGRNMSMLREQLFNQCSKRPSDILFFNQIGFRDPVDAIGKIIDETSKIFNSCQRKFLF